MCYMNVIYYISPINTINLKSINFQNPISETSAEGNQPCVYILFSPSALPAFDISSVNVNSFVSHTVLRATILKYIFCNLCDLLSGRSIFPLLGMTFHLDSIIHLSLCSCWCFSPLNPFIVQSTFIPRSLCFTLLLLSLSFSPLSHCDNV